MNGARESAGAAPLISLRGVGKTHRHGGLAIEVLRDVSLDIRDGEYVAIVGQSGSGKTTLMNLLGCLDTPTCGRYRLDGEDVATFDRDRLAALRRGTFGFVFQRYHLLPGATAAENVEVPAIYAGAPAATRRERARELLRGLGLGDRLDHRPAQLSGGQQQRVSLARALMNGGRVILADEPTGALDSASGAEVMALLRELNERGHTIILVTHDAQLAQQAERVVEIRDGRIVSDTRRAPPRPSPHREAPRPGRPGAAPTVVPDLLEAMSMAVRALHANLFRTLLTLLGIVIGVGSVVAMLALGEGSKRAVLSRIDAMGSDLLVIKPGARGVRVRGEPVTLVADDADAIEALPHVRRAAAEYTVGVTLRAGEADYVATARGTTADYAEARNWQAARGTFFSAADVAGHAPVAVLGQTVAEQLYPPGTDPVGRHVLVNNVPFEVVGVMARKGASTRGSDMDDVAFVPLTTARTRLHGKAYVKTITVQVDGLAHMDEVARSITALLAERHGKEDFEIRDMSDIAQTAEDTQDTLTLLLGSIAAISLLVGGIGVMNIMLVSVTERVREIGIRLASGARMRHILLQFNTEALVVCAFGGVVGVAGGLAAAWIAARLGQPVVFSLPPVLLAFGSAFATGLVFGWLPARQAAALDPVQALAAE